MGGDTLKIKRSGGDGTGKRKRVSRAEGGAAIIRQIVWDDVKRFGLRPCQEPGAAREVQFRWHFGFLRTKCAWLQSGV